jgi:hypothetical protein
MLCEGGDGEDDDVDDEQHAAGAQQCGGEV